MFNAAPPSNTKWFISKVKDHLEKIISGGVDGTPNSFLQSITSKIVQPLTNLFNQILTTGIFPYKLRIFIGCAIIQSG